MASINLLGVNQSIVTANVACYQEWLLMFQVIFKVQIGRGLRNIIKCVQSVTWKILCR